MITVDKLNRMLSERDVQLAEYKLVLESQDEKIKAYRDDMDEWKRKYELEVKQGKVYRTETERLRSQRLCRFCVCKNYHEKGCRCKEEYIGCG